MIDLETLFCNILNENEIQPYSDENFLIFFKLMTNNFVKKHLSGKRVVVRGAGCYSQDLLSCFDDLNIMQVFDINPTTISCSLGNFKALPPDSMSSFSFDVVLIASLNNEEELTNECQAQGFFCWSLRSELKKLGVYWELPEAYLYSFDMSNSMFCDVRAIQLNQIIKTFPECKKAALELLISYYSSQRDIVLLKESLAKAEPSWHQCIKDIDLLESMIQEQLMVRNHKDILLFWIDALRTDFIEYAPFLYSIKEKSYDFLRAYTSGPSTIPTFRGIFYKYYDIKQHFVQTSGPSLIYSLLTESGYTPFYFGFGHHLFDSLKILNERSFSQSKHKNNGERQELGTSLVFWNALHTLLSTNTPIFLLLHELRQTHQPYISPANSTCYLYLYPTHYTHETEPDLVKNQRVDALQYYDKQLSWFCSLLKNTPTKIFMSDHGSCLCSSEDWWDEHNLRINFFVSDSHFSQGKESRLFSLYHFYEFLKTIITSSDADKWQMFSNYITVEKCDCYNKAYVDKIIELGVQHREQAFRAIISKQDKYILKGSGQELYLLLPDEKTNHIGEHQYKLRIQELRLLSNQPFIDINQSDKFKHSMRLYQNIYT